MNCFQICAFTAYGVDEFRPFFVSDLGVKNRAKTAKNRVKISPKPQNTEYQASIDFQNVTELHHINVAKIDNKITFIKLIFVTAPVTPQKVKVSK